MAGPDEVSRDGHAVRGDREFLHLLDEVAHAPDLACVGDDRFVLSSDDLHPDEVMHLRITRCVPCPIREACTAYGRSATPTAGIWGGFTYSTRDAATHEENHDHALA